MREDAASDLKRGTRITLHLKPDAKDLADAQKLGALIKQYSEFIQFPIKLWSTKTEYDQARLPCLAHLPHTLPCTAIIAWTQPCVRDLSQSTFTRKETERWHPLAYQAEQAEFLGC